MWIARFQPSTVIELFQDGWHSIVDRLHQFIGISLHDSVGDQRPARFAILPILPEASESKDQVILQFNRVWTPSQVPGCLVWIAFGIP